MRFRDRRSQGRSIVVDEVRRKDGWRRSRRCYWCGWGVTYDRSQFNTPTQATREHLVPLSRGGSGSHGNVVVACKSCNNARGNQTDWIPRHLWNRAVSLPESQAKHIDRIEAGER